MIRLSIFISLFLLISGCGTETPGDLAASPISDYAHQVSERVTLAGKLNPEALESLAGDGALVIDVRGLDEGIAAEQTMLEGLQGHYAHLPVPRKAPSQETVDALGRLLEGSGNRSVVIHCSSGNRAGLLWASHLISNGTALEKALEEVKPVTTKPKIITAINTYEETRSP